MAALAYGNECLSPWSSSAITPKSAVLEDKFWAALNVVIDETNPPDSRAGLPHHPIEAHSPVVLVNAMRAPLLPLQTDYSNQYSIAPPRPDFNAYHRRPEQRRPAQRKNSGSLRLKVPSSAPFVTTILSPTRVAPSTPLIKVILTPSTAGPGSPISGSATRYQWNLPTPGGMPPSSPALELVSNFLDGIVRLSDSRPSSQASTVSVGENGDLLVMESDVLIQFIEEVSRTACNSPVQVRNTSQLVKLQIPPAPLPVAMGSPFVPSAPVASGPAECAEELDAMSWMRWDRQLSNVQHVIRL